MSKFKGGFSRKLNSGEIGQHVHTKMRYTVLPKKKSLIERFILWIKQKIGG